MAEKISIQAYRERIRKCQDALAARRKEVLAPLQEAEDSARTLSDRKTEAVNVEQRKYDLRKATNPLLVSIIGVIACAAFIAYYLLRSLTANAQTDRKYNICIFFGVVLVGFIVLGVVRVLLKKKELLKMQEVVAGLQAEAKTALDKTAKATAEREEEEKLCRKKEKEIDRLTEEMYLSYPEEKDREEREAADALQRKIEEQQAKEAAYDAMIADSEAKKEQLLLAEEMFDSPKKFIKRDGYQNEFEVLSASAEMGCEEAMSRLVMLYAGADYMNGVRTDLKKALELGERYALSGDGSPMVAETLGEIYLFGKGDFEKDSEKACFWLEKAASKGRKNAMVNFGYCLYTGDGVPQDVEKAKYWFDKAARQGDDQAFRLLDAIQSGVPIKVE